jgi:hypothetical protein
MVSCHRTATGVAPLRSSSALPTATASSSALPTATASSSVLPTALPRRLYCQRALPRLYCQQFGDRGCYCLCLDPRSARIADGLELSLGRQLAPSERERVDVVRVRGPVAAPAPWPFCSYLSAQPVPSPALDPTVIPTGPAPRLSWERAARNPADSLGPHITDPTGRTPGVGRGSCREPFWEALRTCREPFWEAL